MAWVSGPCFDFKREAVIVVTVLAVMNMLIVVVPMTGSKHGAQRRLQLSQSFTHVEANASQQLTTHLHSQPNKFVVFTSCFGQKCKDYDANFNSLRCYVKRHADYGLVIIDFNKRQPAELTAGCTESYGMKMRHCVLSNYMKQNPQTQAVIHMDADCAIYNFEKRFEEFLIGETHMTFDIRFHNGEIMAGVYIVKNTPMSIAFLKSWSTLKFRHNADNGALHRAILDWSDHQNDCLGHTNYNKFMQCFHKTIRDSRCQHGFFRNITVLYPTDAIEYDGWVIQYRFSDRTFIHHAMKNPFTGSGRLLPNPLLNDCVTPKTEGYHVSVQEETQLLAKKDLESAKVRLQRNGFEYPTCVVSRLPPVLAPDNTVSHYPRTFTVVVSVSVGFDDMFRNWLYWYRELSIDATVVLLAEDTDTFDKYQDCGFQVRSVLDKTVQDQNAFSYNTKEYNALVSRRPAALLSIMQEFGNILYSDADIVWKASPFPYLVGDYDFWVQDDGKRENVCTGFMALKRSSVVEDILRAWDSSLKQRSTPNQPAFNTLLKKKSLRVFHLPVDKFMNGKDFFEGRHEVDKNTVVTIHNNWIVGKDKKLARFQKHSLWNPVPDTFCTHFKMPENIRHGMLSNVDRFDLSEKTTITILGFWKERLSNYERLIKHYTKLDEVHKVIIVWNNPDTPFLKISHYKLVVISSQQNSMNNRFVLPIAHIQTKSVITADDDWIIAHDGIRKMLHTFQQDPLTLHGFFGRSFSNDGTYLYATTRGRPTLIITGAMIAPTHLFSVYTSKKSVMDYVDTQHNCEDIAFNFIVHEETRRWGKEIRGWKTNLIDLNTNGTGLSTSVTPKVWTERRSKCVKWMLQQCCHANENDFIDKAGLHHDCVANTTLQARGDDILTNIEQTLAPPKHFNSGDFWESRYKMHGNSGVGSYGRFAEFKAEVINDFVRKHNVKSVVEFGVGDGNQLKVGQYPKYIGVDVSSTIIQQMKSDWSTDDSKTFFLAAPGKTSHLKSELSLSLDVLYHLVEINVFKQYLEDLFSSTSKYVIIYAYDQTYQPEASHVRYRKFTDYIKARFPCFKLIKKHSIENPDPSASLSDFYIYEKIL